MTKIEEIEKEEGIVIDDDTFAANEAELLALFTSGEITDEEETMSEGETNMESERVDRILKRAKAETIVTDGTAFVMESFGRGLLGVTDAIMSTIEKRPPKHDSF